MTDRIAELQQGMAGTGAQALVLRLPENVLLTTDYWMQVGGLGAVLVPREGPATLLVPEAEEAEARAHFGGDVRTFPAGRTDRPGPAAGIGAHLRTLAAEHSVTGGGVGYEGSFESTAPPTLDGEANAVGAPTQALIREAFGTELLIDLTELLESTRAIKSERDIARIRRTNEIAMLGAEAFREAAQPGRTEVEIAAAVESAILIGGHGYDGARAVRAYATVSSGPDLAADGWYYFRSRPRRVEDGETVMLELGVTVDGYWSDNTRTVVAGRASDAQRELLALSREATRVAFRAARPGATGHDVDAASRAFFADHGFEQYPHHTGHGVGFRYHESRPGLVPNSPHVLAAGNVIVAEPGVYLPGVGGFRWEDDAVVGADGATVLATSDYGLD
jgi:Xaa-Pro aminopeptidase